MKAGFKVRAPVECFSPFSKTTRQGWEETGSPAFHPAAISMSHRSVHALAAGFIEICLPVWFRSFLNASPAGLSTTQARLAFSLAVGVGQYEQPVADVRPADFRRRYDARCNAVAHALKVSADVSETEGQMACDILEETPPGLDLGDDPRDVGPEVARVILASPEPREAERLARITGRDDMNAAAPRPAVKGSQIVPDKSRSQGRVRHPCHESGCCTCVPLDETHSAISWLGDVQTEVKSCDPGAKAEAEKFVMS